MARKVLNVKVTLIQDKGDEAVTHDYTWKRCPRQEEEQVQRPWEMPACLEDSKESGVERELRRGEEKELREVRGRQTM